MLVLAAHTCAIYLQMYPTKTLEGKWQHVYVCFDGRIESIYINDKLISQKDIQLLVKPSQFMLLGKNAEEAWPFSGYLHSLKLWDEYIPYKKQTKYPLQASCPTLHEDFLLHHT